MPDISWPYFSICLISCSKERYHAPAYAARVMAHRE
jgi:hypothetical protein